jgi:tetratricopeptide (TPR) repeat protein
VADRHRHLDGHGGPTRLTRAAGLLFNLGEVEAAKSYTARAIQFAPPNFLFEAELKNLGGKLAALEGDMSLAEEGLRAANEAEPDRDAFARDLATFLVDQNRTAEALEVVDRALSLPPPSSSQAAIRGIQTLQRLRARIASSD